MFFSTATVNVIIITLGLFLIFVTVVLAYCGLLRRRRDSQIREQSRRPRRVDVMNAFQANEDNVNLIVSRCTFVVDNEKMVKTLTSSAA